MRPSSTTQPQRTSSSSKHGAIFAKDVSHRSAALSAFSLRAILWWLLKQHAQKTCDLTKLEMPNPTTVPRPPSTPSQALPLLCHPQSSTSRHLSQRTQMSTCDTISTRTSTQQQPPTGHVVSRVVVTNIRRQSYTGSDATPNTKPRHKPNHIKPNQAHAHVRRKCRLLPS